MADTFPAPFGDEIKGVAKATGLPTGTKRCLRFIYCVFSTLLNELVQNNYT